MPRQHRVQTPGAPVTPMGKPVPESIELAGIGDESVTIDVAGREVPMNDIVQSAFESSGLNVAEWNAMAGENRDEMVGQKRNEMVQMFSQARSEMPDQATAQRQAQAAVDHRRQARAAQTADAPAARAPRYPDPEDLNPKELAAPVMTSRGWMAPDPKGLPPQALR